MEVLNPEQEIETLNEDDEIHLEWETCEKSFVYFLKQYGKVVEPYAPGKPLKGAVPFVFWPHLVEGFSFFDGVRHATDEYKVAKCINPEYTDYLDEEKRHLVVLKARQIGWSWLLANYAFWMANFHAATNILMFSKGEKECWALLKKVKQVWEHMPIHLRWDLDKNSNEEMSFTGNDSTIKAFASTESAGVGESASLVIADEWEYHPFAERNHTHAKPTIDSSGGQWIGVFTVNKLEPETFAKNMFKQAYYEHTGEFSALFHGYTCRPGRDEEWYQKTMETTPVIELKGLSPELYMQQSYPRTAEEALAPVQSVAAFNLEILDAMKEECKPPLDLRRKYPDLNHQLIRIYKDYIPGRQYVAATDTGHGVGKDYSVSVVMDCRTCEVVAVIMHNRIPVEEFCDLTLSLLKIYHNPHWYPEDNDWGSRMIAEGLAREYKNFGYSDIKRQQIGFHSNDASRRNYWGGLQTAINNRQIVIYDIEGLKQFYDIIWNVDPNRRRPTRLEAMPGRHDDFCTAVGIAKVMADKAALTEEAWEPIDTLDFDNEDESIFDYINRKRIQHDEEYEPISTLSY